MNRYLVWGATTLASAIFLLVLWWLGPAAAPAVLLPVTVCALLGGTWCGIIGGASLGGITFVVVWMQRADLAPDWALAAMIGSVLAIGFGALLGRYRDVELRVRRQNQDLRRVSTHDGLTGLLNRLGLEEAFARLHPASGMILFVDLDGFKAVNDRFGHAMGDDVLREVGRRLTEAKGTSDAVTARLAGDEFVLLLPGVDPVWAQTLAEDIHTAIIQPYPTVVGTVRLGASVGVVPWTPGTTMTWAIHEADQAMYEAKNNGGGINVVTVARTAPGAQATAAAS